MELQVCRYKSKHSSLLDIPPILLVTAPILGIKIDMFTKIKYKLWYTDFSKLKSGLNVVYKSQKHTCLKANDWLYNKSNLFFITWIDTAILVPLIVIGGGVS